MYAASNTAGTHKVEQFFGAEIGSTSANAISCSLVLIDRIESEKPFVDVYRAYVAEVILYWSVALLVRSENDLHENFPLAPRRITSVPPTVRLRKPIPHLRWRAKLGRRRFNR